MHMVFINLVSMVSFVRATIHLAAGLSTTFATLSSNLVCWPLNGQVGPTGQLQAAYDHKVVVGHSARRIIGMTVMAHMAVMCHGTMPCTVLRVQT